MKYLSILALIIGLLLTGLIVQETPQTVDAQSGGCAQVGGLSGFISESASRNTGSQAFIAGETISISGTLDDNSSMSIRLVVTGPSGTDVTGTNPSFTIPSDGNYDVTITNTSFQDGNVVAACGGSGGNAPTDGRLDPDPTEPFAIYCEFNELIVYQIYDGEGVETNRISLDVVGSYFIGEAGFFAQNTRLDRISEDSLQITMNNGVKVISLSQCFSRAGAILPPAPFPPTPIGEIETIECGEWWLIGDDAFNPECPNSDGDRIYDTTDQCPFEDGLGSLTGCPDLDYDGVPDKDDLCPETPIDFGLPAYLRLSVNGDGCDDRDGDGIFSDVDQCPSSPGDIERNGCPPLTDRDGDGILNFNDWCPARNANSFTPPYPDINGCPDYDEDGLAGSPKAEPPDYCAMVAGPASNGGCPEVLDLFSFAEQFGTFDNIIIEVDEARCIQWSTAFPYGDTYCSAFSDD